MGRGRHIRWLSAGAKSVLELQETISARTTTALGLGHMRKWLRSRKVCARSVGGYLRMKEASTSIMITKPVPSGASFATVVTWP